MGRLRLPTAPNFQIVHRTSSIVHGLPNALLNFRQYEPTYAIENVIHNELVLRGFDVDVGEGARCRRRTRGRFPTFERF